jgi:hypothetical protein
MRGPRERSNRQGAWQRRGARRGISGCGASRARREVSARRPPFASVSFDGSREAPSDGQPPSGVCEVSCLTAQRAVFARAATRAKQSDRRDVIRPTHYQWVARRNLMKLAETSQGCRRPGTQRGCEWSRPTDGACAWDRRGTDARLCRTAYTGGILQRGISNLGCASNSTCPILACSRQILPEEQPPNSLCLTVNQLARGSVSLFANQLATECIRVFAWSSDAGV